jgi:hypothetical protein
MHYMRQSHQEGYDLSEPVKETLSMIRAHSTIRFIALPFFVGAIALLAKAFYDQTAIPKILIVQAGLGLCLVGAAFEIVLSRNLISWWQGLDALFDKAPQWKIVRAHRNNDALWTVRWALFLPYPVTLVFWLDQLLYYILSKSPIDSPTVLYIVAIALSLLAGGAIVFTAWKVWIKAEASN